MEALQVDWSLQIFWTLAVVATLLLIILLIFDLFNEDGEQAELQTVKRKWTIDAPSVLLFFTAFGWGAVITSYMDMSLQWGMIYAVLAGLAIAISPPLLQKLLRKYLVSNAQTILTSTGKVMQPIPPHQAGRGKVSLQTRRIPVEVNAVTQGEELPVGAPIRVVGMVDEHTILVESIDGNDHKQKDKESPNPQRPPSLPA